MTKYKESTFLEDKACEFVQKYFDDMRLARGCIVEKYCWIEFKHGDAWLPSYDLPDEWEWQLNAMNYRYLTGRLKDAAGKTNNKTRAVVIDKDYVTDDKTLLHEMIHVFEGLYDYNGKPPMCDFNGDLIKPVVFPFIRDALLIGLYNDLKGKIANLDDRILAHANIHSGMRITIDGGNHDILFFLKSLDLDLRLGYPFGTVCGYGRDEYGEVNIWQKL